MKSSPFTLLELVVVIGVLALTATLATATIRTNSPSARMRDAALHFEAFCSTVRFQAMEDGEDKIVVFSPEQRKFHVKNNAPSDPELQRVELSWTLPENFEIENDSLEEEADESGEIEMFRFFSNGSACGSREFVLKCESLIRSFEISSLTGRFMEKEGPKQE